MMSPHSLQEMLYLENHQAGMQVSLSFFGGPWYQMKKQIPTAQTGTNILAVMQLLKETPERLTVLSKGLSPKELQEPPGTGERSFSETLAHLLNIEAISSEAIYLALIRNEPMLPDIHAERDLGRLIRWDLLPFPELLAYYHMRRAILLQVLGTLEENGWSRCVRENGKQRKESVYWRARGLALHELEHVQDLELKIKK